MTPCMVFSAEAGNVYLTFKDELMAYSDVILGMFGLGPWEIGAILVVGLLVFGNKLPSVGKSLGKSIIEFKKGVKGIEDDIQKAEDKAEKSEEPPKDA